MRRILLVEDDVAIAKNLQLLFRLEGFVVTHATTCQHVWQNITDFSLFDLALLDVSMPDGNGFALCTQIQEQCALPVLFLSAASDEASVVTGLHAGARDYITKPFRPRELLARIEAALRTGAAKQKPMQFGALQIDSSAGLVLKAGKELFLSALEYRLLLFFAQHAGQVIERARLLGALWDAAGEYVNDNTLTVYIKRLREKIEEDPATPTLIRTVRGLGYKLEGGASVSE